MMVPLMLAMLLKKRELAAVCGLEMVGVGIISLGRGVAQRMLELRRGVIFTLLRGVATEAVEVGVGEVLATDKHVVMVASC